MNIIEAMIYSLTDQLNELRKIESIMSDDLNHVKRYEESDFRTSKLAEMNRKICQLRLGIENLEKGLLNLRYLHPFIY
jgi:hypothetical protein